MIDPINPTLQEKVSQICDDIISGKISQDDGVLALCNASLNSEIEEIKARLDEIERFLVI